jgi:hypothetical protein
MKHALLMLSAILLIATPVLAADLPKPGVNGGSNTKAAPAPHVPVCKWPDKLEMSFTLGQVQTLAAYAANQDVPHSGWQSLAVAVNTQANALSAKYCK